MYSLKKLSFISYASIHLSNNIIHSSLPVLTADEFRHSRHSLAFGQQIQNCPSVSKIKDETYLNIYLGRGNAM